jgi:glycosyltransferase involved in cell wall biosynthesis
VHDSGVGQEHGVNVIDNGAPSTGTSVIIAAHTFQRCDGLTQAVASAMDQRPPPYEVVVVVDNNPDLYDWVHARLPDVVAVDHRGPRGASATRNSGARVAQGRILAFLDDDAVARPDWLQNLTAPLARPDVVGVGGYVEPIWLGRVPHWMPEEFLWVVGASYRGMPGTAGPIRNVWSENMAVSRSDFLEIGGFREGFGKSGLEPRGGEDTDFCIRLATAMQGGDWWYEPSARVGHSVPPSRSTLRFFVVRCYNEGQTKADMAAMLGPRKGLQDERRHATKTLPVGMSRELRQAVVRKELAGAQRASAIGVGLCAASLGYVVRRAQRRSAA